ncbi:MAG: hypothetical protein WCX31_02255 [Salinivirgaceae bacterium]
MKNLFHIAFLFTLCAISNQLSAQDADTTIVTNTVPPMEVTINPVKTMLDNFLPDTVLTYSSINQLPDFIDIDLTGCYKSYGAIDNKNQVISISIQKGQLVFMEEASTDSDSKEEVATVNGYQAKLSLKMGGQLTILEVAVNGKVVSYSYRGSDGSGLLKEFAQQFNYSLISNL